MEKLQLRTHDLTDENIEKIGALFPSCITEKDDENGKLVKAIDFDVLIDCLSKTPIASDDDSRYTMLWPGKRAARQLAFKSTTNTLRPCPEESVNFENTENLYIEGDNLEVLKLLRETYLGKVKMIYIDPPYNTGNDFIYNDDFRQSAEEYVVSTNQVDEEGNRLVKNTESSGRFHSDWLNMMYPRLLLARDLLSDDGVIFISIDDNEVTNLGRICDEIFGENNFITNIPWQSRLSIQNDTDFSINHEYICCYAKIRRQVNRRLKENNVEEWKKKDSFVFHPLPLDKNKFSNPDNDSRGLWKADPFDAPNVRPNLTYTITNPYNGKEFLPPNGRHWRTEKKSFLKLLEDNRIVFGSDGESRPQLKVFYSEKEMYGSIDNSWFSAERTGTNTQGTKELLSIFDGDYYFNTPKPTTIIKKLLYLSNVSAGDLVLDFFSGSATTAHAVMQMNAEDNGNRKFIMVQLPEPCNEDSEAFKAGYKNICEIGKERIRRAGKKIQEEHPDAKIDTGFRVLKVDSSNTKDIFYKPEETQQRDIDGYIDNLKEDRSSFDLLFQIMLELGIPLDVSIKTTTVNGLTVYNVAGNSLIACFDKGVSEDLIKEMAKQMPLYAAFRDVAYSDDSTKINVEQIFKQLSKDTKIFAI